MTTIFAALKAMNVSNPSRSVLGGEVGDSALIHQQIVLRICLALAQSIGSTSAGNPRKGGFILRGSV